MMTLNDTIKKCLFDSYAAAMGATVVQGPKGDWDYFYHSTLPHHIEDGKMIMWEVKHFLKITPEFSSEASKFSEDKLTEYIKELEKQIETKE